MLREELGELGQLGHLPVFHRDVQFSRTFELGVDPVSGDGGFDAVEVLPAEPFERVELAREPVQAVGFAVGQAAGTEAAVAAGRRPADGRRFDQDDVAAGIGLLGLQCGPQTGVTAADDDQIGVDRTDQRGQRRRCRWVVEPEHGGFGLGQRAHRPWRPGRFAPICLRVSTAACGHTVTLSFGRLFSVNGPSLRRNGGGRRDCRETSRDESCWP